MADLKISQLSSATLPLAGTEVLPIVQSSTTVKVAVDDLTAKNIRANATTGILQVTGPAAGTTRVMTVPNANFTAARTDAAQTLTGTQTISGGNVVVGAFSFVAGTNKTFYKSGGFYDDGIQGNSAGIGAVSGLRIGPLDGAGNATDNTIGLGSSSFRWSTVFAANGTINTSDATTKQDVSELDAAEKRVAASVKTLIKKFRFIDAVEKKGDDARIHVGVIAQEVKAAFEAENLDAHRYGLFCEDSWYEVDGKACDEDFKAYTAETPNAVKRTRLGIRYEQLLCFVIASV